MLEHWPPCLLLSLEGFDIFDSSANFRPNANPHPESANVSSFIKSDFGESAISSEYIAQLVHCCSPSKSLVNVVKDSGSIRLTYIVEVFSDLGS